MKGFCTLLAVTGMTLGGLTTTASALTIGDIVRQSSEEIGQFDRNRYDFDILLQALDTANLLDAVDNESADLTVFAPNDKAFIRLARDLGYDGRDEAGTWEYLVGALGELGDPVAVLTNVLLYHVAPESLDLFDVILLSIFGEPIETLLLDDEVPVTIQPYFFKLIDNEPDLRNPRLFFPFNVVASNGIIHTINRVLIPLDLP